MEKEKETMKKLLALILCVILALGTIAVIGETSDLEQIKANLETVVPGKLTVATSPDFAPYEFYAIGEDEKPTLAGFDIALAQYVADYLGLEIEIIAIDFDGVLAELASGNVDLGFAGLSPTEKRKEVMDFSDVYYFGGQSFVCIQGQEDKFPTLEAANNPAYSIGAQNASIQQELATTHTPDANIVILQKVTDIIAELLGQKLEGAFIETAVAANYQVNYPELVLLHKVPYDSEGSAVGVKKGSENLLKGVNLAINQALSDGSMDKFVAEANELSAGKIIEGLIEENK
jgi:polar amino acid transport system substrate-binding protein